MKYLFLGKWWHWLIVVVGVLLMWLAGKEKLHVIHFNAFVLLLILATLVVIVCIVRGTGDGEQVTRDPIDGDL